MPLLDYEDFVAPSRSDGSRPVYEVVQERVRSDAAPMPPGIQNRLHDRQIESIDLWIDAGTPPPSGECELPGTPLRDATGNLIPPDQPLTGRAGETCYELRTHGDGSPMDSSPYVVTPGEQYVEFYFRVPWSERVVMSRVGTDFDNVQVLHHWLLFASALDANEWAGRSQLAIGPLKEGHGDMLAGWAVGGTNLVLPEDVALELPGPGDLLLVQWHYLNSTGETQSDRSAVQVCVVPHGERENTAAISLLGTENLLEAVGMPPGFRGDFSGSCRNNSGAPITIVAFWPHMHEIGRNMRSVIHRNDGSIDEVFNEPFDFNFQRHYETHVVLDPDETLVSTCSFENDSDLYVPYGPLTRQEMCYQFTIAYPVGALENGAPSLLGAKRTCW